MAALLLAHFLADFAFQTDWMVRVKQRGAIGLLPHIVVVALCTLLSIIPAFGAWLPAALVVVGSHALIDIGKIAVDRRLRASSAWLFFLDQALHVGVIVLAARWAVAGGALPLWQASSRFWAWALGLTFSAFVVGICLRVLYARRRRFPSRWLGSAERGAITLLAAAGWPILAPLAPLARYGLAMLRGTPLDPDSRFEMLVGDSIALAVGVLLFAASL